MQLTTGETGKAMMKIVNKVRHLESLNEILYCDRWHESPQDSFDYHNALGGTLSEISHDIVTGPTVAKLLQQAELEQLVTKGTEYEKGAYRFLHDKSFEAVKVPIQLQAESEKMDAIGQSVWQKAHKDNDLAAFLPIIKQQFEVKKELAQALNPAEAPYQVLVNRFDAEYTLAELDQLFAQLKPALFEILDKNQSMTKAEAQEILANDATKDTMDSLCQEVLHFMQVAPNKSKVYQVQHPVCVCVGPDDSRPSTNYQSGVFTAIQMLMHESGHGMYSYNSAKEVVDAGLWGGIEGAMHESQSQFYEKIVGGSQEFWTAFYPIVGHYIPKYQAIPFETFYRALHVVNVSPLRLEADEVTYNLHIVIRYEMERAYFEGKVPLEGLADLWKQKYQNYLGVTADTDTDGLLQDVHWGSGHIGYFQSYVLGIAYASQFYYALKKAVPDAFAELAKGNIKPINVWLKEHVHQYGQLYTSRQLLKKATDEDLNIQYLIDYLTERYAY